MKIVFKDPSGHFDTREFDGVVWMEIEDTQLDADEIWNLAIEEAAKLVAKNYDPMEPWIEPDQIRALRKPINKQEG